MPRGQEKPTGLLSGVLGGDGPGPRSPWAALAVRSGPGGRIGRLPREGQAEPEAPTAPWLPGASPDTEARAQVAREVHAFAEAWFAGDASAMTRCLHPDFVHRLLGAWGAEAGLRWDPQGLVREVVGPQGQMGAKTAPERWRVRILVLDVRARSASAVAELAGWVLHLHLARSAGRWSIVNALWEMPA